MGFSARNRRKQSLLGGEPRPSFDNSLLRRLSTESTDSQEEVRLVSSTSEPELQRTRSFSTEGCHLRTLSEKTTKVIKPQKSNSLDLDLSSFDFSELRSNSLSSTQCWVISSLILYFWRTLLKCSLCNDSTGVTSQMNWALLDWWHFIHHTCGRRNWTIIFPWILDEHYKETYKTDHLATSIYAKEYNIY